MLPVLRNGGWNLWTQSLVSIWGARDKIIKKDKLLPQNLYYYLEKQRQNFINLRAWGVYLVVCDDK